ncbi:18481_t:CDS:2 [Funneliformis geosporum]|uniref:18481_t:CDS:1 n=1 Tax=Funneliformis geosporum TaxID=1117311 RepID=A0A9W4SQA6_9GLOM|nr:18481_t:CDS:2 [Funneliformis geosporum]
MREEFTEDLQEIILMQLDLKQETQQECQVCEAKSSKSSYNITTESPQKNSNCFNVRNKDKKTWQTSFSPTSKISKATSSYSNISIEINAESRNVTLEQYKLLYRDSFGLFNSQEVNECDKGGFLFIAF